MTVGIRQIIEQHHFIPHRVYPGGPRAFAPLTMIHLPSASGTALAAGVCLFFTTRNVSEGLRCLRSSRKIPR
jgi:hypothetical protein